VIHKEVVDLARLKQQLTDELAQLIERRHSTSALRLTVSMQWVRFAGPKGVRLNAHSHKYFPHVEYNGADSTPERKSVLDRRQVGLHAMD
jgi:hypothetical protein